MAAAEPLKRPQGHRLKIRADTLVPLACKVELDGVDISYWLTGIEIKFSSGSVTHATIGLYVENIDLDARTLSVLQAHVDEHATADRALGVPE